MHELEAEAALFRTNSGGEESRIFVGAKFTCYPAQKHTRGETNNVPKTDPVLQPYQAHGPHPAQMIPKGVGRRPVPGA